MIFGVGSDLIEIARVLKACERETFSCRVFTENERREAFGSEKRLAGDFAVKEAVSKSLGTGFRGFGPKDIEVLRDDLGKPYVKLYGEAGRLAARQGIEGIFVSISNTGDHALAFAVAQGRESEGRMQDAVSADGKRGSGH